MSNEQVTPPPPAANPVEPGPPWLAIFAGFSFVATVAVLAAILLVRFAQNRPVNLEEPSRQIARNVDKILHSTFLPTSRIEAKETQEHDERGSRWIRKDFDVTLAPQLDAEGIAGLVERELRVQNMNVVRHAPTEGAAAGLRVLLAKHEVANVRFTPGRAKEEALADLRAASAQLADEVRAALAGMGMDPAKIYSGEPETREDADARWLRTRMEARYGSALDPGEFAEKLKAALTIADTEVEAGPASSGVVPFTVLYRKKPCVELALSLTNGEEPMELPLTTEPGMEEMLAPEISSPEGALEGEPLPLPLPLPLDESEIDASHNMVPLTEDSPAPKEMLLAKLPEPAAPRSKDFPAGTPRIALVLDDGGYELPLFERALALYSNITFAILPFTPHAQEMAQRAVAEGTEVILHMPMETDSATVKPYPGQLEITMDREQIAQLTLDAMAQIPGAIGVNNHTGSKFTANAEHMGMFLESVKEKDWFFLDSVTGPDSQGMSVAKAMEIPTGRRHVFLDDVADATEMRRQWKEMQRLARKDGEVIAIGHFRPLTLDVLEEELPALHEAGFELVPVSELMK